MLRTPFASERIQMTDPTTGIKVIQLTSYPSPSAHFPYYWPSITPDNARVLLYSQRWAQRDAPWDIYRVDADGLNLYQLTEHGEAHEPGGGYYGRPHGLLTLDGKLLYVLWGSDLHRIDVETGEWELIAPLGAFCSDDAPLGQPYMSVANNRLFMSTYGANQRTVRVDLDSGECAEIDFGGAAFGCFQSEGRMVVQTGGIRWGTIVGGNGERKVTNVGDELAIWTFDQDGNDPQFVCPQMFAHATVLGNKPAMQGCGLPPNRCIWVAEPGKEPEKRAQGPYFWHSGASYDGEWIVADTNWPDCGIQLIHVPTGHFRTICHAGATQDHYEFGHCHPTVSQDGRLVVFRSDRTGMSQVYVAHITDEFRESIIVGELDRPNDKWM